MSPRAVLLRVLPWSSLRRVLPWCAALSVLPWLSMSAAERPHFDAARNTAAITVDGREDDWTGTAEPFGKEPFAIQLAHDDQFIYVRLVASDPAARGQFTRMGLTVWFDPRGGSKKVFGIRYPVFERSAEDGERGGRGGYGRGGGRRGPGAGAADEAFEPPDRVDVLGPGKDDARSLTREHLQGIEVAMRVDEGVAVYELKVPLARSSDHPYAIEAGIGSTIGIGVETPKIERPSFGGREGGFGGGRGGGGFGGFGGRRGGGARGGEREFQPPKPIKAWGTATLR